MKAAGSSNLLVSIYQTGLYGATFKKALLQYVSTVVATPNIVCKVPTVPAHVMKTFGEVYMYLYSFLASEIHDGGSFFVALQPSSDLFRLIVKFHRSHTNTHTR
jgi:hypothetical protein